MLRNVVMPTLGLDMEEATIQAWLKREGDAVVRDELLLVVETDKASIEINAPETGILRRILHPQGASVPVTQPIAVIETSEAKEGSDVQLAPPVIEPETPVGKASAAGTAESLPDQGEGRSLRASPAARRLARDLGIQLRAVKGSGPQGRVQGEDVRRAAETSPRPALESKPTAPRQPPVPPIGTALPGRLVPLGRKRRITAQRMAQSSQTVARITLNIEVDATELVRLRGKLLPALESTQGVRLSYNDFLVKVAAVALTEHPELNARWTDQGIYLVEPVNIGLAVAVDDGLVVPVIKHANRKKLGEIAVELNRLATRAREDRLTLEEVTDGTFTITNLGMFDIDAFTPLVNPPEAAILGVGRIAERPVGREGQLVLRPIMILSLSADHRIVDGAPAARFLQRIRQLLEDPYPLLLEGV